MSVVPSQRSRRFSTVLTWKHWHDPCPVQPEIAGWTFFKGVYPPTGRKFGYALSDERFGNEAGQGSSNPALRGRLVAFATKDDSNAGETTLGLLVFFNPRYAVHHELLAESKGWIPSRWTDQSKGGLADICVRWVGSRHGMAGIVGWLGRPVVGDHNCIVIPFEQQTPPNVDEPSSGGHVVETTLSSKSTAFRNGTTAIITVPFLSDYAELVFDFTMDKFTAAKTKAKSLAA